jgi:hypothetical protein
VVRRGAPATIPPVRGHRGKDEWGGILACAPGAAVLLVELVVLGLVHATGSEAVVYAGLWVGVACLAAAVVVPFLIFSTWQQEPWAWAIVSVCVSVLAFPIAGLVFFHAALHNCGPDCLG